jgi:putative transposase
MAKRVKGTLRRERLDQMIVLNKRHLLRVLHEYADHHNAARPHRTLSPDSPNGREPRANPAAQPEPSGHKMPGGLRSE